MPKFLSHWTWLAPSFAWLLILLSFGAILSPFLLSAALVLAVLAAVHHAELIAHRVGEPFGTFLLAVAVTVIELGLIVTLMSAGGENASTLARDTLFAAVMIILTGLVGICILIGAIVSFLLDITFVAVQSVRHRDYFLPPKAVAADVDVHAQPPSNRSTMISSVLLLACLGAVVLLAKTLAPPIEAGVAAAGAPRTIVGVIIAALVLLPEGVAAVRAALANRLQTSLNLGLGSALATIGLSIPAVAALSLAIGLPIALGLDAKSVVLLFLTLIVATLSLSTGRTTILQGMVHLVILGVYLFTTIVP